MFPAAARDMVSHPWKRAPELGRREARPALEKDTTSLPHESWDKSSAVEKNIVATVDVEAPEKTFDLQNLPAIAS